MNQEKMHEKINPRRVFTGVALVVMLLVSLKILLDNHLVQRRMDALEEVALVNTHLIHNRIKLLAHQMELKVNTLMKLEGKQQLSSDNGEFSALKADLDEMRTALGQLKLESKASLSKEELKLARMSAQSVDKATLLLNSVATIKDKPTEQKFHKMNLVDFTEDFKQHDVAKMGIICKNVSIIDETLTMCVHDKDHITSSKMYKQGEYSSQLMESLDDYLSENPEAIFIDIGAQIGQYSLMAAKLDHYTIAVEPRRDSNILLGHSAVLSGVSERLVLVHNWIGSFRSKHKEGGSHSVEKIVLDDLVHVLPPEAEKSRVKAALKIDMDGFSPLSLQNGMKLLQRVNVEILFMNWAKMMDQFGELSVKIEDMLKQLENANLKPYYYENKRALSLKNWKNWPNEVVFKKDSIDL